MRELTGDTRIRIKKPLSLPCKRELTGDTRIRLSQIKDLAEWVADRHIYKINEISPNTGLMKTEHGWVVPPKDRVKSSNEKPLSSKHKTELERFAKHVELPGLDPQKTQILINTLQKQWSKYKFLKNLEELIPAKPGDTSAGNFRKIELDIDAVNNTETIVEMDEARRKNAAQTYDRIDRYLKSPNPQKKEEYEALLEKVRIMRDTTFYVRFPGHEVECEIMHEIGHVIADQRIGMINRQNANRQYKEESSNKMFQINKMIFTTYLIAKKNHDIEKLSFYAMRNRHEFFAEAFVMYSFAPDKMPGYIREMVEAVIK